MKQDRLLPDPITAWDYYYKKWYTKPWYVIEPYNNYITFLQQPLALWMFIPCKDGKPLEKPNLQAGFMPDEMDKIIKEYQEAEARVIFEGFEVIGTVNYIHFEFNDMFTVIYDKVAKSFVKELSIHDLANKVTLTEAKFKKLGLTN